MKITPEQDVKFEEVVEVFNNGGVVIYPTETTYGCGVDATNQKAVEKLALYKNRPPGKPYSIMVTDQKMAEEYVQLNETAKNLYKNFLPGPMTVVSKMKLHMLADGVASEAGTVGIRISSYTLVTKIVKALRKPITATSANASYNKRPYQISDILENISEKQKGLIDLIIDAGELPANEPSMVVDTTLDDMVVLRQGGQMQSTRSKMSVVSGSEEETKNFGKELWQKYKNYAGKRAIIFALEGPMGVGKTVFTKSLAKAMGIEEEIVSPTFVLSSEFVVHGSELKLEHIDTWRMQDGEELENLGLKGMINDKSVMAIEWADKVENIIRKYNEEAIVVWIKMEYTDVVTERIIKWSSL